ncbi:MAG: glycosyltransferase family 10 [Roseovarius sp.]
MPHIAILPYGAKPKKLGDVPLDQLHFPLGAPLDLSGHIRDLGPQDHIILYPNTWIYGPKAWGINAKCSVMVLEPKAIHKKHMVALRFLHRSFHCVFTCNPDLLNAIPNGKFLAFGGSWVSEWKTLDCAKTEMTSLIASAKRKLEGHKLRHALIDTLADQKHNINIMGRGFKPFEIKSDGLAPYRYSVVIENVCEPSYFTEKLIDAFLCETVPIYWGAPDIGQYFDTDGMILCDTLEDIKTALTKTSTADYAARQQAITDNKQTATAYIDFRKTAASIILEAEHPRPKPS